MSSADLLDDGFPHGTKAGYDRGCHSGGMCAGKATGQTCKQAVIRYRSDRTYKRLVDGGAPLEVQQLPEGADLVGDVPVVAKPVARPRPPAPRPLDVELAQDFPVETAAVDDAADRIVNRQPSTAPEPLHTVPAVVKPPLVSGEGFRVVPKRVGVKGSPAPLVHGTRSGYLKGCRRDCPGGVDGVTCQVANREYQRAQRAARKTTGGTPAAVDETPAAVNETPGTENVPDETETGPEKTTALAEVDPSKLHVGDRILVERDFNGTTVRKELVVASEPEQRIDGAWTYDAVDPAYPPIDWLNPAPDSTPDPEETIDEQHSTHPAKVAPYRDDNEETTALAEEHPPLESIGRAMGAIDPEPSPGSPWTGPNPTTPDKGPRRSPHATSPFSEQHWIRHMLHLAYLDGYEAGRKRS